MTVSRVFFCAASMDGERRNLVRYENGVTYVRANPAAPHGGKVSPRVGQRNVHCIHLMAL